MDYGPALLDDLQNYALREKIMYAATMALNGLTLQGKNGGDWGVHATGHCLSLLFDTPHGASLTIVYPAWMRYHQFFRSVDCPVRLSETGIARDQKEKIIETMKINHVSGSVIRMTDADYPGLVDLFL